MFVVKDLNLKEYINPFVNQREEFIINLIEKLKEQENRQENGKEYPKDFIENLN